MRKAYIIAGLGYGDEGKGTIVDYLTYDAGDTLVVRYNGGSQAAHNVVTPDGRHHTFSQFGSGTLAGARTHLSKFMLINPLNLEEEAKGLATLGINNALSRVSIDEEALVITPFQQAANRIKSSIYGDKLSSTCGKGIGETVADAKKFSDSLKIGDLIYPDKLRKKLLFIQEVKRIEISNLIRDNIANDEDMKYELSLLEEPLAIQVCLERYRDFIKKVKVVSRAYLPKVMDSAELVIFEGAQGILLDINKGFSPYITHTDTTTHNAETLLEGYTGEITKLGIIRTYFTRHGNGPFVTEDDTLDLPELHNIANRWQRDFRLGYFDLVAARYAIEATGSIDEIAITHNDYLPNIPKIICQSYRYVGDEPNSISEFFDTVGNRIIRIKPCPNIEEKRQKLTWLFFDCKPNYITVTEDYLKFIESSLNTKISIISSSPTFTGKIFTEERK